MVGSTRNLSIGLLTAVLAACGSEVGSADGTNGHRLSASVVKLHVTAQRQDYAMPWQGLRPVRGTGSGFVIEGRKILTNAHVVSDARMIEVQKDGSDVRFRAELAAIAHDCDLAMLSVEDPAFFENTRPVELAAGLPALNDEVSVIGYPLGGSRISVTRGVVSRIDYSAYSHSATDQHLVLQVDAAINPGNSGGPILYDGKLVGLAFQGLAMAENIGYGIPLPVIVRFLRDMEDGNYHGYPELGITFLYTRNEALRRDLGLPDDRTGIAVAFIDPFGSGKGHLRLRDVMLSIDGHRIESDGTVTLNGNSILYAELLERKQWGQSIAISVWRDGAEQDLEIPLRTPYDPFVYRNLYDERPRYVVFSGLVFSPLTRNYLATLRGNFATPNDQQLLYLTIFAKSDGLDEQFDEFVVLTGRLPHPVNTYMDRFEHGVVSRVNGRPIRNLADLEAALKLPLDGFHSIYFLGMDEALILRADEARRAQRPIMDHYGVKQDAYLGEFR